MKRMQLQLARMSGLAFLLLAVGGCSTGQLTQERTALFAQNQKLQQLLTKSYAANDVLVAERDRLAAELQDYLTQAPPPPPPGPSTGFGGIEGIDAVRGKGIITVRVPGDVLFSSGKIVLKSSARKTLAQIADVIKSQYPTKTIRVVGHTDTDPIKKSKWVDNLQLSQERAAAVHRYLATQGLAPEAMEAVGKGPWDPRGTKALSRRVEIVVVLSE